MTPSVRQIEIFLRVVECGSIGRAAEELRIAQPVASRALKALERGLGASLLARTARGARPTEAGRALQARGADLLRGFGELAAEVQRCASEPSGRLSVGVPPSLAGLLAERVLPGFARFPKGHAVRPRGQQHGALRPPAGRQARPRDHLVGGTRGGARLRPAGVGAVPADRARR